MRRWLLIGNSRWHWAAPAPDQSLQLWHTSAADGADQLQQAPAAWAAVGSVPKELERWQPQRLLTSDVPLAQLPPALGVDRALAAWGAWQQQRQPVLVADAGTALSLTLVDAAGCFQGGRLMAGGRLQLQALHQGTADLPTLKHLETADPMWATHTTGHGLSGAGGPNRICRLQMPQRREISGALMQRLQLQAPTSHQPPPLKTASTIHQRQA